MNIVALDYPAPAFAMTPRGVEHISDCIIHHTAGSVTQTPLEIDQEHRNQGWAMIGYNYVIAQDGTVYAARPIDVVPSAAFGRNTQSVNVCLVGNFQSGDPGFTGPPPAVQVNALQDLCVYLHHRIPTIVRTIGHRDVALLFYADDPSNYATACPGNMLYAKIKPIRAYVSAHLNSK